MLDLLFPKGRKADDWWSGGGWGRGSWISGRTLAGPVIDEDLALTYSAVWCACRVLSEAAANLPLITYRQGANGDRFQARDHGAHDLLRTAPNPTMGAHPFRIGRVLHQLNWGQGFAEIEREQAGNPTSPLLALWPIHPSRVRPSRPGDRYENHQPVPLGNYLVRNNDNTWEVLKPEEMLHVPGCFPEDGIWGKSTIAHAREDLGFGLAVQRHGASFFGSGAQPKAVLKLPGMKDKQIRSEFRQEWKEVHGSPDSGEVAILPPEGDYTIISLTNEDSQFLETLKDGSRRVAQWYRVPPHMLAELEGGASFASIEMMSLEFVIYSLMPWLRGWEDQLCLKLFSVDERKEYFVEHNLAGLLRGDWQTRWNGYQKALSIGCLSINEIRRLENMNGIGKDGDVYYLPANLTTAAKLARTPAEPGSAALGSDQSGFPDQDGGDPTDRDSFERWTRALPRAQRESFEARLRAIERALAADYRAAQAPVPAPAARALPAPAARRLDAADGDGDGMPSGSGPAAQQQTGQVILEVPNFAQKENYTCGAAASHSVAAYFGVGPSSEGDWVRLLGTTPDDGTPPAAIMRAMVSLGLYVSTGKGMAIRDLAEHFAEGRPVLLCMQSYGEPNEEAADESGHWVVAIGIGLGYVYLQDPAIENVLAGSDAEATAGRVMIRADDFLKLWHDMGPGEERFPRFGLAVSNRPIGGGVPAAIVEEDNEDDSEMEEQTPALPEVPAPDGMRDAARAVLVDVLGRMFAKEVNAVGRALDGKGDFMAWLSEFYPKHAATMQEALGPACVVVRCVGANANPYDLAVQLATDSRNQLQAAYVGDWKRAQFAALLAPWPTARAEAEADRILNGE